MYLLPELRVRRGLVQSVEELSVRALKASEQLVSHELRGHVVVLHLWGVVRVSRYGISLGGTVPSGFHTQGHGLPSMVQPLTGTEEE